MSGRRSTACRAVQAAGARHAVSQPRLRAQRDGTCHHRDAVPRPAGGAQSSWPSRTTISTPQATAQPCSSAASTASTARCRPTCPTAATMASSATSTSNRGYWAMSDAALKTRMTAASAGSRRVFRPVLPMLTVAAVALLAGCAFQKRESITVGAVPDDYRTNHPIVIAEKEEILDLPVAASDRGATAPQRASLEGFLAGYDRTAAPVLTIARRPAPPTIIAAADAARDFAASPGRMACRQAGSCLHPTRQVRKRPRRRCASPTRPCGRRPTNADAGRKTFSKRARTSTTRISVVPIRTTSLPRSPILPTCSDRETDVHRCGEPRRCHRRTDQAGTSPVRRSRLGRVLTWRNLG